MVCFNQLPKAGGEELNLPEWFKLIGIVIIVIGLALKLRTTIVVVTAGLVTGVIAGLPLFSSEGLFQDFPYLTRPGEEGIINMLGRAFTDNRLMTLFIITLPAIGLAERHGLQEQSARLIRRIKSATVGRSSDHLSTLPSDDGISWSQPQRPSFFRQAVDTAHVCSARPRR